MNKYASVFLVFLLACIVLYSCTEDGDGSAKVQEGTEPVKEAEKIQYEEKIYSKATIDQKFDGRSVLVVMDKHTGGVNKKHEKSFFGGIEIESIEDLTYFPGGATNGLGINWETWRQILCLHLPINSKENVLYVISVLEKIDGIKYADPNYYDSFDTESPTDS